MDLVSQSRSWARLDLGTMQEFVSSNVYALQLTQPFDLIVSFFFLSLSLSYIYFTLTVLVCTLSSLFAFH
jgi:hypothetical protein